MIQRTRKYLQVALRLLISGAALYYVLSKTDLNSLGALLRNSNPFLLVVALVFFSLSKVMSAYRLNVFLRADEIYLENSENLRLYWLGMYYNLFLPGGIGGDGYKVYYLKKYKETPVKKSIKILLFDRVTGVLALIFMSLLIVIFIPEVKIGSYMSLIAVALMILAFYLFVKRWFTEFYPHLNRTNLQSLAVQVLQLICTYIILIALGENTDIMTYLLIFLVSSVVAVIPFTIGGVGARELTFLYAATILNLDIAVSVSLSLLFFLITALVSLAGILYSVRPDLIAGNRTDSIPMNSAASDIRAEK